MTRDGNQDIYDNDLGCPPGSIPWYPSCLNCPVPDDCQFAKEEKKETKKKKKKVDK